MSVIMIGDHDTSRQVHEYAVDEITSDKEKRMSAEIARTV